MTTSAMGYKIGKASQMTGISPDKLRIWERRYSAVTPVRTDAGGRLYASNDISRLKIIKSLIDNGDSIGNIASLSLQELQLRVNKESKMTFNDTNSDTIKVVLIGDSLISKFSKKDEKKAGLEIVASFRNLQTLMSQSEFPKADILFFEKSAFQNDNVKPLLEIMDLTHASYTLILYRFASQDTLDRLPKHKFRSLRSPVSVNTITDHCRSLFLKNISQTYPHNENADIQDSTTPARRYDDETLVKIAEISPAVKCECPHHLAELVFSLTSFEKYSNECENLNQEDADLHAYLGIATAKARHIIEDALEKVIEIENIEV